MSHLWLKRAVSGAIAVALRIPWVGRRLEGAAIVSAEDALAWRGIVRWGDGETSLALGISTNFQRASWALARDLRALMRRRSKGILLCVPTELLSHDPFKGRSREYVRIWALTAALMRVFSPREAFGDAFMFRRESGIFGQSALIGFLRACKKIVVVSSNQKDVESLSEELQVASGVELVHVRVPSTQAYDVKASVLVQLKAISGADAILLSAGPVGKVLVRDLVEGASSATKVIDTGNFFEHLRDIPARGAVS